MDDNKVAVLLENLMSQFRTFGDGLDGLRVELKQFREETNNRFDKLEFKLDAHIEQNRREFERNHQDHQQLIQAIKETDTEVQELKRVK